MEEEFEEYWTAIRPNRDPPKKPKLDLEKELREHASRMAEAMEEMTGRRSPPTSEVMLDDFTDSLRFASTAPSAPEADAAPRLYVDDRGTLGVASGDGTISVNSEGGVLSIAPGGNIGWTGINSLQISGNSDVINLQDRLEVLTRELSNILGRVLSLEYENRELRAHIASVDSVVRNQRR